MTYKDKTLKAIEDMQSRIEIMKAFVDGRQIQEYVDWVGWKDINDPSWAWVNNRYRIKPDSEPIPATPEEIEEIESIIFIKPIHENEGGIDATWADFYQTPGSREEYYIYNKSIKCWDLWK